jgi:hypothetical protein
MGSRVFGRIGAGVALMTVVSAPAAEAAKPDLVVRSLTAAPVTIGATRAVTVADVTVDEGRKRARPSWTSYALRTRHGRVGLGGRAVPALASKQGSRGSVELTVPAKARDGAYSLVACADARREIRERREGNNCRIASSRLVLDTVAPAAPHMSERPDTATNRTSARFAFSHPEAGVSFLCQLDSGAAQACNGSYEATGVAEGSHHFEVRAIDAAGNHGSPATVEWTVDGTPPASPLVDERPASVTAADSARFAFHHEEPGVRFACALDDAEPSSCQSPIEFPGLSDEEHAFTVLAIDAAGNRSEPVQVSWIVVPDRATLNDGAWCWFADPRAVHFNGRTFVGWTAQNGDIEIAAYDHTTLTRTTARVGNEQPVDDHNNPAIQILPDRRVRVYWSLHGGSEMWYRTSLAPEDVTAWGPLERVGSTTPGGHGYSYPNPVHLSAEGATYVFFRGGNWNPTFAVQPDGQSAWSPAANVVYLEGERPYMKVASNGVDRIAFAYTDGHPAELEDVNIHYAEYRAGPDAGLYTAGGRRIGALGQQAPPTAGDMVYDPPFKTWVHDVTLDAGGRPVVVFAGFPTQDDHRYFYARWTGEEWDVHELVAAGGSMNEDGRQPYYSGGITLDHESPDTVYLAREVDGVFEVETWRTPDGGGTWSSTAITAASDEKNVRPVSPRGMLPFSSDLGVIWMRGAYPHYLRFQTSIATILATGGNRSPVADATVTPPTGSGPLTVALDASGSSDEDGRTTSYEWDLADGTTAAGDRVTHTFREPGTYFPRVTVTDDSGASDVYVVEVTVDAWQPAEAQTGPAWVRDDGGVTLSGTLTGRNQETTYHFEYGVNALDQRTPEIPLADSDHAEHVVRVDVDGLTSGVAYRYRLVATNETGTATGSERTITVAPPTGSAYRSAVLTAPGVLGYWRLGEAAGTAATSETGLHPGAYSAQGVMLSQIGALTGDPDTSTGFDGVAGEMSADTEPLSDSGTLEGWFDWRRGVALMRDHTTAGGWILAYDANGELRTRIAGTTFTTDLPVASFQNGWHHFAVAKDRTDVRLYVDGKRLALRVTSTGSPAPSAGPWHIMRNGRFTAQYTEGRADEIAVYTTALTLADIRRHYEVGRG